MTQETLKLALEALEDAAYCVQKNYCPDKMGHDWDDTIAAIHKALAQPEQEPVAWMTPDREGFRIRFSPPTSEVPLGWDALYTAPPQRHWVGLTDEEIDTWNIVGHESLREFVRAIEAKLKEKNT